MPKDTIKFIEKILEHKGPQCRWCGEPLQEGKLCQKCKQRVGSET